MRILDEFNFGLIKVTIFSYNEKLSVKFEKNLIEIIMKFRDGTQLASSNDVKLFCTESLLHQIDIELDFLAKMRFEKVSQNDILDEDVLPEIY